jgi:PleD family two-component response regulator
MLTNARARNPVAVPRGPNGLSSSEASQRVVIVNGSADMTHLLEHVLDAGRYDVVFVESNAHAYSQIKRVKPNLVILCVRIEDVEGFQVLSMLKLDDDTRAIPVLTYTTEYEEDETGEVDDDSAVADVFTPQLTLRMN